MKNHRFKLFSSLFVVILLGLAFSVTAADKKDERPIPKVYPFSTPYDEPHCPSGKCSRANENPKHTREKAKFGMEVDED